MKYSLFSLNIYNEDIWSVSGFPSQSSVVIVRLKISSGCRKWYYISLQYLRVTCCFAKFPLYWTWISVHEGIKCSLMLCEA